MAAADGPWYKDPPKLVAVIGGLVAATIGVTQLVDKFRSEEPLPTQSAEYVLDVSRGMAGMIGNKPKLGAVEAKILSHVKDTPNLATALRLAGPSCSSGYQEPDVQFAENNGNSFDDALRRVQPGGKGDFARSVRHAVNDLIGPKRAASGKSKTLYIFVGGPDTCSSRPDEVIKEALHDLRPNKNVEVTLEFFGIKVPANVRRTLRSARKEAKSLGYTAPPVEYANTPAELDDALPDGGGGPPDHEYGDSG
jgi:hypothetical protein